MAEGTVRPSSVVDRHEVIDEVLDAWAPSLGDDRIAYRGHVYRVYNVARRLAGSARHDHVLAIASAFHDVGIWSDRTFDYLAPSTARAQDYLRSHETGVSLGLIADVICNHHVLRRIRAGADADVIEAFRQADLVDVSGGWFGAGLDRAFLREVVRAFPYAGFHGILVRTALSWFVKHPLRPIPVLRLSGVLQPRPPSD